jgi:uncharacterized circularly permuted ATP-grasp superfamily protein
MNDLHAPNRCAPPAPGESPRAGFLLFCGTGLAEPSHETMAHPPLFNEMFTADGSVRPHYAAFAEWLAETPAARITQNRRAADLLFHRVGITFAVYGEASGTERLIPFDIVPHVIPGAEWERIARGLRQRVGALNRFLHDVYHQQEILKAGKIPADQV